MHYFDLADNVLHLVPGDHKKFAAGPKALEFFHKHYQHQVYKSLAVDLPALVEARLTGQNFDALASQRYLGRLHATGFGAASMSERITGEARPRRNPASRSCRRLN